MLLYSCNLDNSANVVLLKCPKMIVYNNNEYGFMLEGI